MLDVAFHLQVAASSLEEEVAMLRAEAPERVVGNSVYGLRLEVWDCLGMLGRSLLVMDFLQCGYRIAQSILVILQCIDTPLCR